ncbi:MAG: LysR substrate-binding domain-containing protein [Synoicihabitans sp.]
MELQQLRYILAIADTGNFTRAAEATNVSQPSLSQQIAKLESELDHRLFHRLGRRAVPTDAGEILIERARRILFEVDNVTNEIQDDPALGSQITVGMIQTVAPYLLPKLIERCRERYPHLQINSFEGFRGDLVRGVLDGRVDLALVATPYNHPQLSVERMFEEPLQLVVGRKHRLASKRRFTAQDLREETFIMMGRGSTLTEQVQEFCGEHDFEPSIGYRCAQVSTLKSLVALGLGIAILPQIAYHANDHDRLIFRKIVGRTPTREIGMVRHLQRYQSQGTRQFLKILRETLRGFGTSPTDLKV